MLRVLRFGRCEAIEDLEAFPTLGTGTPYSYSIQRPKVRSADFRKLPYKV